MSIELTDSEKNDIDIFVMSSFAILTVRGLGECSIVKTLNFILIILSSKPPTNLPAVLEYLSSRIEDEETQTLVFLPPKSVEIAAIYNFLVSCKKKMKNCVLICREEDIKNLPDGRKNCVTYAQWYEEVEIKEPDRIEGMFPFYCYSVNFDSKQSFTIYHLEKLSESDRRLNGLIFMFDIGEQTYIVSTDNIPLYYISDVLQLGHIQKLKLLKVNNPETEDLGAFVKDVRVEKLMISSSIDPSLEVDKIISFAKTTVVSNKLKDKSASRISLFQRKSELKSMLIGLMASLKVMRDNAPHDDDIFGFGDENSDEGSSSSSEDESSDSEDSEESEGESGSSSSEEEEEEGESGSSDDDDDGDE